MFSDLCKRIRVAEIVVEECIDILVAAKDSVYLLCFQLASSIHILNVSAFYLL